MSRAIQVRRAGPEPTAGWDRSVERVGTSVPLLVTTARLPVHHPSALERGEDLPLEHGLVDAGDQVEGADGGQGDVGVQREEPAAGPVQVLELAVELEHGGEVDRVTQEGAEVLGLDR